MAQRYDVQLLVGIFVLVSIAGCSREPQKTGPSRSSSSNEVASHITVLAIMPEKEFEQIQSPGGRGGRPVVTQLNFNDRGRGVFYIAEKDGMYHVVHNGQPGKLYASISQVTLSPDGSRIAYGAMSSDKWFIVVNGKEGPLYDSISGIVFSPDSRHVAYYAAAGQKNYIVVDGAAKTASHPVSNISFNVDARRIAYVERNDKASTTNLIVGDSSFRKMMVRRSAGDVTVVNADRTMIAATSQEGKKQSVVELSFAEPGKVKKGKLYDSVSLLTFAADGASVAYVAKKDGSQFFVLNGREESLPEGDPVWRIVVRPDHKGAGVLLMRDHRFFLHQAFYRDNTDIKEYDETSELTYGSDGSMYAYTARMGNRWFVVVNGKEGPAFDMAVSPLFSPDGKFLVYRARKDGKRFVVVADENGNTLHQHPKYQMVFPVAFTGDGKSVAYGVKDGQKLVWRVDNLY